MYLFTRMLYIIYILLISLVLCCLVVFLINNFKDKMKEKALYVNIDVLWFKEMYKNIITKLPLVILTKKSSQVLKTLLFQIFTDVSQLEITWRLKRWDTEL